MRSRQLAAALALAAVALIVVSVIFAAAPDEDQQSFAGLTPPSATGSPVRAKQGPHRRPTPLGPSATPSATPASKPPAARATTSPTPDPAASRVPSPTARPSAAGTPKVIQPAKRYRPGSRGVVYLTFDDGPGPATPQVLSILSRTGSTATFFEMGNHVAAYPSLTRAVRAQGSRVGNHTYDHPDLTKLSPARVSWELAHGPAARCVRPPYGAADPAVRAAIARIGARQVLWTVDTVDWSRPGAAVIAQRASGPNVHAGSIVLMHDGGGDRSETLLALPVIIQNLHLRGYVVRSLPYC